MSVRTSGALSQMTIVLALGLVACGSRNDASNASFATGKVAGPATQTAAAAPNLAQGPDLCFRAIAKLLGADAKVSEITSFFSAGSDIDSSDTKPKGEMKLCTVDYQDPSDPRKLLSTSLDVATGVLAPAKPVEITVAGGDAATFKLEDYIIPLSKVDPAALTAVMTAQKARLDGIYSHYAWTGVRLSAPGPFSDKHTLRLDITGRLASNDIKGSGYASVTTDGKTITADHLKP